METDGLIEIKSNDLFTSTIAHIEGVLDRHKGEDPLFLSAKMMEILIDHRQGDPSRYAAIAEKAAKGAEISREGVKWHIARTYWTIKSRWHDIEGDAEKSREAKLAAAETYVKEGEDALQRPSSGHSVAAHFLQGAIEALKKIENTRDERQEIYQKMLEYQKKSISEMGTHPYSIDVSEIADKAIEMVKGKSLFEALMNLAFSSPSPKVDRLRTRVQEAVRTHPMSHIFSASLLDKEGKVVGRRPGISSREEASEEAIRSEMFRMAASDQVVHAQAVVQNAIYQINLEHNVRFDDLLPVVSNNPFVPPGREYIFARGLHSGLTGDLLLMAHLLIPQLENSLRHLLSQRGVIVSGLDDQQIQENYTLNAILYRYKDELTDILGDDALFDLQGLLVERFGSNLRNLLAHGLLDQNEFFSWHILYLWWLVLRLCLTPIYIQIQRQREHSNTETNNNADSTEDNQNNN